MGTGKRGKLPSGNYSTVKRAQRLSATSSIRPNGRVQLSICDGVSFWDFDVYERARRSCKYLASLRKNTGRSPLGCLSEISAPAPGLLPLPCSFGHRSGRRLG